MKNSIGWIRIGSDPRYKFNSIGWIRIGSDPSFKLNSIGWIRIGFGNRSEGLRNAFREV